MASRFLQFFHCLTGLHNGAGQGLGAIDRPIIREATTNYPFVQSSTIKGAYLAEARGRCLPWKDDAFGKGEAEGNQGGLLFGDATMVLLPVRSLAGTLAWVTSELSVARIARLFEFAEQPTDAAYQAAHAVLQQLPTLTTGTALGCGATGPAPDGVIKVAGQYMLEGLAISPLTDAAIRALWKTFADKLVAAVFPEGFWRGYVAPRVLCLSSGDFDHLAQHATQIEANIKIRDDGTTQTGSLRYTEFLPAETVLVSFIVVDRILGAGDAAVKTGFTTLASTTLGGYIQLGADESKGKGLVRTIILGA